MQLSHTLEEINRERDKGYSLFPVFSVVSTDTETPISLFKKLATEQNSFLLESVEGGEKWARYSFIGRNPFLIVKSQNGKSQITEKGQPVNEVTGNPVIIIQKLIGKYRSYTGKGLPRFTGGAVGFLGYDTIRYYERLVNIPKDDMDIPESHFLFIDELLVYDHLKQKSIIVVNMHLDRNADQEYERVAQRIREIYTEIVTATPADKVKSAELAISSQSTSNISKNAFCANVIKAKEYIRNGDIFQVVLSQRLNIDFTGNPFTVYRSLRSLNPSPYMYFFRFDNYSVAGASPEMLVRVENGTVETCPIAGTRKRGLNEDEDLALERELLADEKELSEHRMLVDLGRNDVGRVSEYGSVAVKGLMHIEKYSHVMHIVSGVTGRLRSDKTIFDALMSVLPAGTLSGAPKVRAMEIIDEMETTKRGIYGGAIGYIGFDGNIDSCIAIRTIVFKDAKAFVQTGCGIVAESIPENEYEECMNKAGAMVNAIKAAREEA